jgi:hypothetical protein
MSYLGLNALLVYLFFLNEALIPYFKNQHFSPSILNFFLGKFTYMALSLMTWQYPSGQLYYTCHY